MSDSSNLKKEDDPLVPDWLKNYLANQVIPDPNRKSSHRGNPHWYKGMKAPNPKGRPKGIPDRRAKMRDLMQEDAEKVIRTVIQAALNGDMQACAIIVNRICPPVKPTSERINIEFDATAPLVQQVQRIVQAVTDGDVPADVGKQIIESIGALAAIKQAERFERRLSDLERRRPTGGGREGGDSIQWRGQS